MADPITSADDDRYAVMQAAASTNGLHVSTSQPNESLNVQTANTNPERLKSRGFSFERLPGTSKEIRSIAAVVGGGNGAVDVRVGADATKERTLDTDLSRFRFLHFATHGVLPADTNIREPALVLSYDGISASDMFLTSSEILKMRLHSDLVVLSACNTGSGAVTRAEGVMSLGRAFLAAGASSVTVSLWQVAD